MNQNMKSIIKAYATITQNRDVADIIEKLSASDVFCEIATNNSNYLYESYTANLLEIVNELKQHSSYPEEIDKITSKSIVDYNKRRKKDKGVELEWSPTRKLPFGNSLNYLTYAGLGMPKSVSEQKVYGLEEDIMDDIVTVLVDGKK